MIADGMTYIKGCDPIKIKAVLYFMFYTGLRAGEITRLKRRDINLKELRAIVRNPNKNNEERYTFFPQKIGVMLQEYFDIESEEYNAFNMTHRKLSYLLARLKMFLSEKKNLSPHILRHSFANLLAENEIGIRVAQKLLGHKSLNSTLIYYDPDLKIVEKIYRKNLDSNKLMKEKGEDNGDSTIRMS